MTKNFYLIKNFLLDYQFQLTKVLENIDTAQTFFRDSWNSDIGEGITCSLSDGKLLERCGINFSHIKGEKLPLAATLKRPELKNHHYEVLGVSVVIHPTNPFVPSAHCNVRFFNAHCPQQGTIWWFGGGFDLTPYYGFKEDCIYWHQMAYQACELLGQDKYFQFKQACDEYFYIPHRKEARGIGGIFFDDLNEWPFEVCFEFMQRVALNFQKAYINILNQRKNYDYSEEQREFQLYRRGRYVEFNLVNDRGTAFGLQSNGRIESILMSLPPKVIWKYNWKPRLNSPEAKLYEYYLKPKDWLKINI